MATASEQGYLKSIYRLAQEPAPVTVGQVAKTVGVSHPSASAMVKKLAAGGLVRHRPFGALQLTRRGEAEALRVVRRHRLLETFLFQVLRVPWDEVHEEAEIIEHALSDRLEQRMADFLGNPTRDPHGDPIPPTDGEHVERVDQPLAAVQAGKKVRITRVCDRDPKVLRYLAAEGLTLGVVITVEQEDPFGGPLWVTSRRGRHALGPQLVGAISVSEVGSVVAEESQP